jgi:transposase
LIDYCRKFFPERAIFSAYEAGFSGFYLHRELVINNINNIVVHPASIEIASRDRVKTDKRDSLKIATQLSSGRLKSINVPSLQREAYRAITRLRDKLVKDRTRISVQIKAFLNLNGMIDHNDTKRITKKAILEILLIANDCERFFYLKSLSKRWIDIDKEIHLINSKLKEQASEEPDLERIYQSFPGIGPLVSRILINELGDMSQFKNEKALFSYTGLTPQEYSSGEHTRQGHISRQGKPILRKILVQAAWSAVRKNGPLKEAYERISEKAGKKRAIIGVARRLIGQIRSCLQKNEIYKYG